MNNKNQTAGKTATLSNVVKEAQLENALLSRKIIRAGIEGNFGYIVLDDGRKIFIDNVEVKRIISFKYDYA